MTPKEDVEFVFDAKPVKAKKQHQCMACLLKIVPGETYISYPAKFSDGKMTTRRLCIECTYLMTRKDGKNAFTIREGEFSERLIPNCLRKKRNEYRKDPKGTLKAAGFDKPPAPREVRKVERIIVKTAEFDRRIFHLPEGKFQAEQFSQGGELTIKAGVNGKSRTAKIVMAKSTSGEAFGCSTRQVAVLTA